MNLETLGEFGWIERIAKTLETREGVMLGIGDDAAILDALSHPVVTCDALVEDVHFRRDWISPRALGRKSLAVNVSDIAAMGGLPVAAFVSLAVSSRDDAAWLDELYAGFEDAAREGLFTVAGGDTVRSRGAAMIHVCVVGNAPHPLLRSGAQVGDSILVTGNLGESAAGLWVLENQSSPDLPATTREHLVQRHLEPTARIKAMQAALKAGEVHAALDLSDGLAGDAAHIARRSRLSLEIDVASLPVSPQLKAAATFAAPQNPKVQLQNWMLAGGEDYELLLCVAPESAPEIVAAIESTGVRATTIGRCIENLKPRVILREDGAEMVPARAWTHF